MFHVFLLQKQQKHDTVSQCLRKGTEKSLFPTCHGFPSHNSTSLNTLKSIRPVISFPPLPASKISAKIQGNATWDIELGSYHHTAVPPFQRIALSEFGSKYPNRIDFTTDHWTWSTLLSRWYPTLQTPMNGWAQLINISFDNYNRLAVYYRKVGTSETNNKTKKRSKIGHLCSPLTKSETALPCRLGWRVLVTLWLLFLHWGFALRGSFQRFWTFTQIHDNMIQCDLRIFFRRFETTN